MVQESGISKRLWLFFLFAYAFSWLFWIPQALAANGIAIPAGLSVFLSSPFNPAAFGPLVAALLLTFLGEGWKGAIGLLKRGLDFRFKKTWLFPILLLPPLIFTGATLLSVFTGATPPDSSVLSNPVVAIVAPVMILLKPQGPFRKNLAGVATPYPTCKDGLMRWFPVWCWVYYGGCGISH